MQVSVSNYFYCSEKFTASAENSALGAPCCPYIFLSDTKEKQGLNLYQQYYH